MNQQHHAQNTYSVAGSAAQTIVGQPLRQQPSSLNSFTSPQNGNNLHVVSATLPVAAAAPPPPPPPPSSTSPYRQQQTLADTFNTNSFHTSSNFNSQDTYNSPQVQPTVQVLPAVQTFQSPVQTINVQVQSQVLYFLRPEGPSSFPIIALASGNVWFCFYE